MKYSPSTGGFYSPEIHGNSFPPDAVDVSGEAYLAMLAGQASGKVIVPGPGGQPILVDPPEPSGEEAMKAYTDAVQRHLDTVAASRGYDGILSACTYATSTVPKFHAEGQACVAWRDQVWAKCYEIIAQVKAGTRPFPTLKQVFTELPAMVWPG